ncbi:MAG: NUDIX hydrolase [Lachnospiraceae bacterium]|nr:NUDIX hydrolase [Lachnospiraceae bacterium]
MLMDELKKYVPINDQETADLSRMLAFFAHGETPFHRTNTTAHFTASAWIVNPARTKVLMVYHNIYNSWSWTGGHADGEEDLLAVALREAREETGIEHIRPVSDEPFSLEILTVNGHEKRGKYVSSHLHYNVTYLMEAEESDELRMKPDENSGVAWFTFEDALKASTEPWMVERVYRKLIQKMIE